MCTIWIRTYLLPSIPAVSAQVGRWIAKKVNNIAILRGLEDVIACWTAMTLRNGMHRQRHIASLFFIRLNFVLELNCNYQREKLYFFSSLL